MEKKTEWQAEQLFLSSGPYIHLYSTPLETALLVENDDDRTVLLNMIALNAYERGVEVLAYAIMSNHIHLMLRGTSMQGLEFFEVMAKRYLRYLSAREKPKFKFTCGVTTIADLRQFRTTVAYIVRNPYVVRDDIHIFAYLWCSGYLYFNPMLDQITGESADKVSYRLRRMITRASDVVIPASFRVNGHLILPDSFVSYALVEALFGNAKRYLFWVMKNVEAQVEMALSYGEMPHCSDDELFVLSRRLCEKRYAVSSPEDLPDKQKKELAIALRNLYHATNSQLARLTTLDLAEIHILFPSAKTASNAPGKG